MIHTKKRLNNWYNRLSSHFGPQHWWPGETPFEVMVGAVLTQNTAWTNVEKAIANIKKQGVMTPRALSRMPLNRLARCIQPSGFFNVKARRLKSLLIFLETTCHYDLSRLRTRDVAQLRADLLSVHGIGPETADAILLYACEKPVFVIDAYTKRICSRHGICAPDVDYHTLQSLIMDNSERAVSRYNEYHALLVACAKKFCKTKPHCNGCPLHNDKIRYEKN